MSCSCGTLLSNPIIQTTCYRIFRHIQKMPLKNVSSMEMRMKVLVVGLGNQSHPHTRHSVGMTFVNHLAHQLNASWSRHSAAKAMVAIIQLPIATSPSREAVEMILVKSKFPMNANGKSVSKIVSETGVPTDQVYLAHDELDHPVGKNRIKDGGSARGHNGVKSVQDCLRTVSCPRLLIGVDRPASKHEVVDYVLSPFTRDESSVVTSSLDTMTSILLRRIERDLGLQKNDLVIQDMLSS